MAASAWTSAINYVSLSRPGSSMGAKPIPRPYAEQLTAAGLMIVSNYQYGKPGGTAQSDFRRGFEGGVTDARTAWKLHTAAGGGQSAPVFFSIDEDINHDTWNNLAVKWFRGINSVLGVQRTGVYGGIDVCQWAASDGVIGNSRTPGHRWAWQTKAWSRGRIEPAAVLYQRVVSTASNPGPVVGGRSRRQRRPRRGLRSVEPASLRLAPLPHHRLPSMTTPRPLHSPTPVAAYISAPTTPTNLKLA